MAHGIVIVALFNMDLDVEETILGLARLDHSFSAVFDHDYKVVHFVSVVVTNRSEEYCDDLGHHLIRFLSLVVRSVCPRRSWTRHTPPAFRH
jgi:hypothetical protein